MNKLLLIHPPRNTSRFDLKFFTSCDPPLGLLHIKSYLNANDIHCDFFDFNTDKTNKLYRNIKNYTHVGFYTAAIYYQQFIEISRNLKHFNSKLTILAGGPDATDTPLPYLNNGADIVVHGEGEITTQEILTNSNLADIDGISYLENNKIITTIPRKRISNLDKLPFPYRPSPYRYFPAFLDARTPYSMSIVTSRGCPFECTFCNNKIFGRSVTWRSASNIIDEILFLKKRFKCNYFTFNDDLFLFNPKRVATLCHLLIDRDINIHWSCKARCELVNPEILKLLKAAGCYRIEYGIESASDDVLKLMNRKMTIVQIQNALRITAEAKIEITANFILGFPGETRQQEQESLDFIKKYPIDYLSLSEYIEYNKNQNHHNNFNRFSYTSPIGRAVRNQYLRFYLSPRKFIRLILWAIRIQVFVITALFHLRGSSDSSPQKPYQAK